MECNKICRDISEESQKPAVPVTIKPKQILPHLFAEAYLAAISDYKAAVVFSNVQYGIVQPRYFTVA